MILEDHTAKQNDYAPPFREVLQRAYVLDGLRETLETYKGREIKTSFTLNFNHFRPQFELKANLLPLTNPNIDDILDKLRISGTNSSPIEDAEEKEICIMFTQGTIISMFTTNKYDHHEKSPSRPRRLDDLPASTRSTMSRMTTPTLLEFSGGKDDILTINLSINCPEWAKAIAKKIACDGNMMLLVDVEHAMPKFIQLKNYIEKNQSPLRKFCPKYSGTWANFDPTSVVANPIPQDLVGFHESPIFKSLLEYLVYGLASTELDRAPEVEKIKAYEDSSKILILINVEDTGLGKIYEGYLTAPSRKEYQLQPGDTFDIRFPGLGECDFDELSWRATVIPTGTVRRNGMLSVIVHRGQHKTTFEYSKLKPNTIDPKSLSTGELNRKIQKDSGNNVRVKLVDCDSAYTTIRAGYVNLARQTSAGGGSCGGGIRKLVLGKALDELVLKDLYRHIRNEIPDPRIYMSRLNRRQEDVVRASRKIRGGGLFVQGPPGTGKTWMLRQLAAPLLAAPKKLTVLVAAPTNHGADDLAHGLCEMLEFLKAKFSTVRKKKPYVLRVHPDRAEDDISRSQGPKPIYRSAQRSQITGKQETSVTPEMSRLLDEFRVTDKPKFEGVRDKRVQDVKYSLGYMRLLISGVIPDNEYEYHDPNAFSSFRALYQKQAAGHRLSTPEETTWRNQSDELTKIALKNASAIVSTTATISARRLLDLVKDNVAAIFLDESAFEREDSLVPLFGTQFSLDPCLVMIGDQQQLAPITKASIRENAFVKQLKMSFMARMINLGMDYIMLTEQHRMVDRISNIANTLTYKGQLIDDPSTQLCQRPIAIAFREFAKEYCGSLSNLLMINLPPSETNVVKISDRGSKSNDFFICAVANVVKKLLEAFGPKAEIALLTAYTQQRNNYARMEAMMRKAKLPNLEKLTIDTLDGAQGRQFDIVIIDLPVGRGAGFLEDEKRLNIAMTRARDGLMVVCDQKSIDRAYFEMSDPYLKRMMPLFRGCTWTREKDDEFPKTEYYTPSEDFSQIR